MCKTNGNFLFQFFNPFSGPLTTAASASENLINLPAADFTATIQYSTIADYYNNNNNILLYHSTDSVTAISNILYVYIRLRLLTLNTNLCNCYYHRQMSTENEIIRWKGIVANRKIILIAYKH